MVQDVIVNGEPHAIEEGSSVADLDRISEVASYVVSRAADQPVVVVVSAMGKSTDELLTLARGVCHDPPKRELDMLLTTGEQVSIALMAMLSLIAVAMVGSQLTQNLTVSFIVGGVFAAAGVTRPQ